MEKEKIKELLEKKVPIFSESELKDLFIILALYPQLRDLLEYSEHLDSGSSFVPALRDLRKALDHTMTFLAIKFDFKEGDFAKELEKTISNLEQATTNVLDYVSVCQKDQLDKCLEGISPETATLVCPNIYLMIYPKIYDLQTKLFAQYNPGPRSHFENCIEEALEIGGLIISTEAMRPDLLRAQNSKVINNRLSHLYHILKLTLAGIIGGIVVVLFSKSFGL